jgi:hypothetical protein
VDLPGHKNRQTQPLSITNQNMQEPQSTNEPVGKLDKKQKILIFCFSLILLIALIVLLLQKIHAPASIDVTDTPQSEKAQTDEEIQTSIEDYCAADLEKFCKDKTGTQAFMCLKDASSKLESSCRDFIKGEQ